MTFYFKKTNQKLAALDQFYRALQNLICTFAHLFADLDASDLLVHKNDFRPE